MRPLVDNALTRIVEQGRTTTLIMESVRKKAAAQGVRPGDIEGMTLMLLNQVAIMESLAVLLNDLKLRGELRSRN